MALTREEIERVAHLARLQLSDQQLAQYSSELSAVLEAMEQLKQVPVEDGASAAGVPIKADATRADVAAPPAEAAALLANAPDTAGAFVRVREGTFSQ